MSRIHGILLAIRARVAQFARIHGPCVRRHAVAYARGSWSVLVLVLVALGAQLVSAVVSGARWARAARRLRLFALELAGVVLVAYGVSYWSVPSAVVLGGLVLVGAVEVRPRVSPSLPDLPVPEALLRAQAEQAARVLNNVRYGVPEVDTGALDKLTRDDCERIISVARAIGAAAKT